MAFKKGDPKPEGSGRKRNSKNVLTELKQIKLEEGLASLGVQISEQLALAILTKDIHLIKALASVLPYLSPRLASAEQSESGTGKTETDSVSVSSQVSDTSTENLLRLIAKK